MPQFKIKCLISGAREQQIRNFEVPLVLKQVFVCIVTVRVAPNRKEKEGNHSQWRRNIWTYCSRAPEIWCLFHMRPWESGEHKSTPAIRISNPISEAVKFCVVYAEAFRSSCQLFLEKCTLQRISGSDGCLVSLVCHLCVLSNAKHFKDSVIYRLFSSCLCTWRNRFPPF